MRNDPVDIKKLMISLESAARRKSPITLTPKEALKLRGELIGLDMMVSALLAEREKYRLIPIEERLPENDMEVLVYYHPTEIYDIDFCIDGEWDRLHRYAHLITHWMPLPKPTESEET